MTLNDELLLRRQVITKRHRPGEAALFKQGVGLHPAEASFHSQPRGLPLVGS